MEASTAEPVTAMETIIITTKATAGEAAFGASMATDVDANKAIIILRKITYPP